MDGVSKQGGGDPVGISAWAVTNKRVFEGKESTSNRSGEASPLNGNTTNRGREPGNFPLGGGGGM